MVFSFIKMRDGVKGWIKFSS